MGKVIAVLLAAVFIFGASFAFAETQANVPAETPVVAAPAAETIAAPAPTMQKSANEISKEQVVAIATTAVKEKGFTIEEVSVIYDDGNELWSEKIGAATMEDTSPNHGILKQGFMKNYRTVFFDFKEPLKDIWVFIDKDTGEVLTVYQEL